MKRERHPSDGRSRRAPLSVHSAAAGSLGWVWLEVSARTDLRQEVTGRVGGHRGPRRLRADSTSDGLCIHAGRQ